MAGNIICSKCGQENEADQPFCGSCGAFLEWSGQKVNGEDTAPAPASPVQVPPGELAGLARARSAQPVVPATVQPPLPPVQPPVQPPVDRVQPAPVLPVRPGPSIQSVPPSAADVPVPAGVPAGPQRIAPPDPTIACPACGRSNPIDRNFCHSCGSLLRPKPAEPAAPRRRGAGGPGFYRPLAIVLLIAIILVGSFLLTRLTGHAGGSGPLPSPSKVYAGQLAPLSGGSVGLLGWSVRG